MSGPVSSGPSGAPLTNAQAAAAQLQINISEKMIKIQNFLDMCRDRRKTVEDEINNITSKQRDVFKEVQDAEAAYRPFRDEIDAARRRLTELTTQKTGFWGVMLGTVGTSAEINQAQVALNEALSRSLPTNETLNIATMKRDSLTRSLAEATARGEVSKRDCLDAEGQLALVQDAKINADAQKAKADMDAAYQIAKAAAAAAASAAEKQKSNSNAATKKAAAEAKEAADKANALAADAARRKEEIDKIAASSNKTTADIQSRGEAEAVPVNVNRFKCPPEDAPSRVIMNSMKCPPCTTDMGPDSWTSSKGWKSCKVIVDPTERAAAEKEWAKMRTNKFNSIQPISKTPVNMVKNSAQRVKNAMNATRLKTNIEDLVEHSLQLGGRFSRKKRNSGKKTRRAKRLRRNLKSKRKLYK
jgi:hypothetical protein